MSNWLTRKQEMQTKVTSFITSVLKPKPNQTLKVFTKFNLAQVGSSEVPIDDQSGTTSELICRLSLLIMQV